MFSFENVTLNPVKDSVWAALGLSPLQGPAPLAIVSEQQPTVSDPIVSPRTLFRHQSQLETRLKLIWEEIKIIADS